MPSGRRFIQLGDLVASISETHRLAPTAEGVFLNTSDVLFGEVLHHRRTQVRDWPGQAKKTISRGDILFSEIRPANGRWAYIDFDSDGYVVSTKLMVLRPRTSQASSRFLYFYLTSRETTRWLQHLAESRSGTFPQITFDQLATLEVPLPTRDEQDRICGVLSSIQDKIDLNRRVGGALKELARTIFKSWFVDFDPVKAIAEGKPPVGMDAETAKLFPSQFVESELGMIPEGWRAARLGDLIELKRGHDLPAARRQDGSYPICSSAGISGVHTDFKARGPGVVTGRYGTIGQVFYIEKDFWPLNTTLYVNDFKGNDERYAFYSLSRVRFANYTDKAAVPGINRNHVHQDPLVLAPLPLQKRFRNLCEPVWSRHTANEAESKTLAELRDLLLPKLISGELRVPAAEKMVQVAV